MGKKILIILLIITFGFGVYYFFNLPENENPIKINLKREVKLTTDYVGAKVDVNDIVEGCLGGTDCIPSIDSPIFESVEQGNEWLRDSDVVFGVVFEDIKRAYPQRIMNWHEIVNDKFNGKRVAVTFCPLCGTAIALRAQVNGKDSEFGVSGMLYNSDLIMYDRREGSLWQQATGEAIVGPAAQRNEYLDLLSTTTTTWSKWKEWYPDTQVLSKETGFVRNYNLYPYGSYESNENIFFSVQNKDATLPAKTVVYGIMVEGTAKAYPYEKLKVGEMKDSINGVDITVTKNEAGEVRFERNDTKEEIVSIRGFWFAWVAFNPDTLFFENGL